MASPPGDTTIRGIGLVFTAPCCEVEAGVPVDTFVGVVAGGGAF
jgi:hypothetical protein